MNDSKDHKAAAEPPLDCKVGQRIKRYLRQLAPHQNEREGPQLMREALAEIERLRDGDTCARMCEATAYRTELRRLQRLIKSHVDASNNDDSAGDTFGALMEVAATVPNVELTGGASAPSSDRRERG